VIWRREYDIFLGWFATISGIFITVLLQFFYEDYFWFCLMIAGLSVGLMISGCSLLVRVYDKEDDDRKRG
jgi:hypothetical protein